MSLSLGASHCMLASVLSGFVVCHQSTCCPGCAYASLSDVSSAGLALGIQLAGLPWQVHGVMLAGPATYYTDQQNTLMSSFMATYLQGSGTLLLQHTYQAKHL